MHAQQFVALHNAQKAIIVTERNLPPTLSYDTTSDIYTKSTILTTPSACISKNKHWQDVISNPCPWNSKSKETNTLQKQLMCLPFTINGRLTNQRWIPFHCLPFQYLPLKAFKLKRHIYQNDTNRQRVGAKIKAKS